MGTGKAGDRACRTISALVQVLEVVVVAQEGVWGTELAVGIFQGSRKHQYYSHQRSQSRLIPCRPTSGSGILLIGVNGLGSASHWLPSSSNAAAAAVLDGCSCCSTMGGREGYGGSAGNMGVFWGTIAACFGPPCWCCCCL
jgi:hypothetical protein